MKKMRRLLSLVMALCLLLGDVAVPVLASENTEPVLEAVQEEMAAAGQAAETTSAAAEETEAEGTTVPEEIVTEATSGEPEAEVITLENFRQDPENTGRFVLNVAEEGTRWFSLSGASGMVLAVGEEPAATVTEDPYLFAAAGPCTIQLFWPEGSAQNPAALSRESFVQDTEDPACYTYKAEVLGVYYYALTGAKGMELTAGLTPAEAVTADPYVFTVMGPCTIKLSWPEGSKQNPINLPFESFTQDAENPVRYVYEVTEEGERHYSLTGAVGMDLTVGEETATVTADPYVFSAVGPCTIELSWPEGTQQNPAALSFESFVQDTENPIRYVYEVTEEGGIYYALTGAAGMELTVGEEAAVAVDADLYVFYAAGPCIIELVWPEGAEQNPTDLPFESFAQDAENPVCYTYEVEAERRIYYSLTGAVGMELTAGGETAVAVDADPYVFAVTGPCTIELVWPEGTEQNPVVLSFASFAQDAENPARYVFEVTEEGTVYYALTGAVGLELTVGEETAVTVDADPYIVEADGLCTIALVWPEGSKQNPLVVEIAQGKAVTLTAVDPETGNGMNPNLVAWAVAAEDRALATVSKGKVTAKGKAGQTAVITATLDDVTIFYEIRITVPASRVAIIDDRFSTEEKDFEVNGMTGTIDLKGAEGAGTAEWVLTAKVYGKDKTRNGVSQKLIWTSSNIQYATVEDGVVTLLDAGAGKSVTITATAADGTGSKASIKIKMNRPVNSIRFAQNAPREVATGKSLKLANSLLIGPGNATNKKVDWWLVDGGGTVKKIKNVASISSAGVLAADKNAPNGTVVTVRCVALDGSEVFGEYSVTIRPATTIVQLFEAGSEANVAGKTVDVYLKNGQDKTVALTAGNLPEGAAEGWAWTCSDKGITVTDGQLTIPASRAGKTITVTATAMDGTNKKGSVKLRIIQPVEKLTLPAAEEVAGGKSVKLAAKLEIWPANATNKKVDWWLVDSNGSLAKKIAGVGSITSAGVFAADKAAAKETQVTVKCIPLDGYADENGKDASVTCTVTIKPITTAVTLRWKEEPADGVFVMNVTDTLVIKASSEPLDAKQDWDWKASVADVRIEKTDDNGFAVTFGPKCVGKTVTITATANDGSNKKASLKIKVVQPVESLTWSGPKDADGNPVITVAQGKSQNLSKLVQIDQTNASNKKLDWVLVLGEGATAVASVKNATLKASAVTKVTEACLVVSPMDGYKDGEGNPVCTPLEIKVMLYPKATVRVAIIDERFNTDGKDFEVNGMTGKIGVVRTENGGSGSAVWELRGKAYPYDADPNSSACQQLLWTSSNTNWAVVDDKGNITLLEAGIGKTVTITAAAIDGSGKKASVKIKIQEGE